jgi:hypothetical protein
LQWSDISIKMEKDPVAQMDTKANLMYKLGRNEEAVAIEHEVVNILKSQLQKSTSEGQQKYLKNFIKSYQDIASKMEKGEPLKIAVGKGEYITIKGSL